MTGTPACPICGSSTARLGYKLGEYSRRQYGIRTCPACRFSFVANPCVDYEKIYSKEYYSGKGADPLVDYVYELDRPRETVRKYEWRGVLRVIKELTPLRDDTEWLDFGCGNGGLVRHAREQEACRIVGFEEGWIRDRAIGMGIPMLDRPQLAARAGSFDIVTAIEVLEHVTDPLRVLSDIRRLLKRGGLFFFTTGNARPHRSRLPQWRYVIPEVHVSFFEPETMVRALALAGFRAEFRGYLPGFSDIMRFKILKNLRVRRPCLAERVLPWGALARLIDSRLKVTAHPIGWATDSWPMWRSTGDG